MAKMLPLKPVPSDQLARIGGLRTMRQLKATFSKPAGVPARTALAGWKKRQPAPVASRNSDLSIRATRPTSVQLEKLRAVVESETAPAEILNQRMDSDEFFGTLYSALASYEFVRMEAEYHRRRRSGGATVDAEWQTVLRSAQLAFSAGGLTVTTADLTRYSQALVHNKKALNAVVRMANTAVSGTSSGLTANTSALAAFVPAIDGSIDRVDTVTEILDLCDDPIAEGSFTKHLTRSFSLTVRLKGWCPTWTNPFRMCWRTYTVAGVSFSLNVSVGYRINCCGVTAWGQAYAQACATLVGTSVCAACSATVAAVGGVSRTPIGSRCEYGVGLAAALECTLFGQTVFSASVPFGWIVSGPCPPVRLCA